MPELSDIAAHFDDINILDGYTGKFLFKAQVSSFLESSKDGSTNKKRVMSVAPGTIIPKRRLIDYFGEKWIVGDGNIDALQNKQLRLNYWITKQIDVVEKLTPVQACTGAAGYMMASSKVYLKDTVNSTTDSEYDPQWDFSISISENVVKGEYLRTVDKLYRVRSVHTSEGGFLLANSDELDTAVTVSARIEASGEFDPVTETRAGAVALTNGILIDPSKLYRFRSQADPRILSGDMTLILPVSAPAGAVVTLSGIGWTVLTCTSELDGFNLHIRRS